MKNTQVAAALAALGLAGFTASSMAAEPPVAVNTQGLQPHIAAQVEARAQEGYTSLARYLERVRPYQRLSYDDLTRPKAEPAVEMNAQRREYKRHAMQWRPQTT